MFFIGRVPIEGDLVLAPMAGYSDRPYRTICREMGSALSYTSCILDEAVLQRSKRTETLVDFGAEERPVAIQMLSNDERTLVEACLRLMELEPDVFDLNLGCPARHVSYRGRGAALLRAPDRIGRMVAQLVRAVPVPVTAKIRLGWEQRNYLEVARVLEDSGVAAIAVHGRTKAQSYAERADWGAIAEVRAAVRVPVLANGDVRTVADIAAIRAATGCAGVMIGRGAVGNPWIFQRRDITSVTYAERLAVIRRHLAAMLAYYGERIGLLLFRKHVVKYVQGLDEAGLLRNRLVACESAAALLQVLEEWGER